MEVLRHGSSYGKDEVEDYWVTANVVTCFGGYPDECVPSYHAKDEVCGLFELYGARAENDGDGQIGPALTKVRSLSVPFNTVTYPLLQASDSSSRLPTPLIHTRRPYTNQCRPLD